MSRDSLEHRQRQGNRSGVRAVLRLPRREGVRHRRRAAGRRQGGQPDRGTGPDALGPGRRGGGRASGWAGWPCPRRPARSSPRSPRSQVELRERGLARIVLCGMGGSSLAPEVICAAAGVELDVLDSSDPDFVRTALEDRLAETVVVVSASPAARSRPTASGGRSRRRSATPASTPPSASSWSPTRAPRSRSWRAEAGYRVFLADPDGRRPLLRAHRLRAGPQRPGRRRHRRAARRRPPRSAAALEADSVDNPGLRLGAPARASPTPRASTSWSSPTRARRTPASATGPSSCRRVHRQGRQGHPARGRGGPSTPRTSTRAHPTRCWAPSGRPRARLGPAGLRVRRVRRRPARRPDAAVGVRHRRRRPDDRDQPVRPARRRERQGGRAGDARRRRPPSRPRRSSTGRSRSTRPGRGCRTAPPRVRGAVAALLDQLDAEHGYVAVQAYLDRHRDAALAAVRGACRAAYRPAGRRSAGARGSCTPPGSTTRAGPPPASTSRSPASPRPTSPSPTGRSRSSEFLTAQAVGDGQVLADHGRPVLRLHVSGPGRPGRRCRGAGVSRRTDRPPEPAAGPGGPPAAPDRRSLRDGDLRRHRRPGAQEGDAGDLRPGQPRAAAARLQRSSASPAATGPTRTSRRSCTTRSRRTPGREFREEVWRQLAEGFRFVQGDFDDDVAFDNLRRTIEELDEVRGTGGNHAFYLAIPPGVLRRRGRAAQGARPGRADGRAPGGAWWSRSRSGTTSSPPAS